MLSMKKIYRVGVDKKGLVLAEEDAKNADRKLCKIKGKKTIKGGMTQLNLHDGRNILVEKDVYKTSDSLLIELPTQKILKHFNFAKNSPAIVVSGKNMGVQGKIKDISERKTMTETSSVIIETKGGEIETVKNYVLVGEVK
jgi:small subunit ribosomal protein S4e